MIIQDSPKVCIIVVNYNGWKNSIDCLESTFCLTGLGFGGGNNIGIRNSLSAEDADFVWLLNNDTVVDPQALYAMVQRMKTVPGAGMCGSTIIYHDALNRIQSLGRRAISNGPASACSLAQM